MLLRRPLLPAVFAAPKISLLTAPASAPCGTLAPLWRSGFIDHQRSTHKRPSVAGLYRLLREPIVTDFHETKPTRFTAETVTQDIDGIDLDASFLKKCL